MGDTWRAIADGLRSFVGPENPPVNMAAKAIGNAFAPPADSPGAALVAKLRSWAPSSPGFDAEFKRYNEAAHPSTIYSPDERWGSVVHDPNDPAKRTQAGENRGQALAQQAVLGALYKTDAWGNRIKVDPTTGGEAAKTEAETLKEMLTHLAQASRERQAEFTAGGPLRSVGFRNSQTGEVIAGGMNHPQSRGMVPWTRGSYEDGYIDHAGNFLTRREATKLVNGGGGMFGGALEAFEGQRLGAFGTQPPDDGPGRLWRVGSAIADSEMLKDRLHKIVNDPHMPLAEREQGIKWLRLQAEGVADMLRRSEKK